MFHVASIFILLTLFGLWWLDFFLTIFTVVTFPAAHSFGNAQIRKALATFSYSKRLLAVLMSKNIEPLLWQDVLEKVGADVSKKRKIRNKIFEFMSPDWRTKETIEFRTKAKFVSERKLVQRKKQLILCQETEI